MIYTEISVHTTTEASEIVADILGDYSEFGVAISDNNDVAELIRTGKANWDYADDNLCSSDDVTVKVYVKRSDSEKIVDGIKRRLAYFKQNAFCDVGTLDITMRDVDGEEWRKTWKQNFMPIVIGNIVVCPDWIDYNAEDNQTIIKIDSNMVFGTGQHETTSLCIELMQKYIKAGDTVIDVGCGSGILGITAAKLKAAKVIMTDIDPNAVTYATHNCALNNVKNADVFCKNLLDDTLLKGNIIVANITAEILVGFAPDLVKRLHDDNSVVILSGILLDRVDSVISAYEQQSFKVTEKLKKGEWCALALRIK